ncbi:MAG: hypothetical protein HQK51_01100 [Oligoflexia bacterium]|nr:hypothetical protein [Oligoflexia bacterium]
MCKLKSTIIISLYCISSSFLINLNSNLNFAYAGARIHDYETTRLKSTAGTGVASVLMEESSVLNPAPIAFFNVSSFYVQKTNIKYGESNVTIADSSNSSSSSQTSSLSSSSPSAKDDSSSWAVTVSDAKSGVKGSVSYQKQEEWFDQRKRFNVALASNVGKTSSLGFMYRRTTDKISDDGQNYSEKNYNQMVIGSMYALNENFTVGMLVVDPFKSKIDDNRAFLGLQFMLTNVLTLIADVGSDYNQNLANRFVYKGAVQINFFSDLYLRAGFFNDKGLNELGNGVGIGWVSPRLLLEAAMKNTEFKYSDEEMHNYTLNKPKNMREIAFSISYRF